MLNSTFLINLAINLHPFHIFSFVNHIYPLTEDFKTFERENQKKKKKKRQKGKVFIYGRLVEDSRDVLNYITSM